MYGKFIFCARMEMVLRLTSWACGIRPTRWRVDAFGSCDLKHVLRWIGTSPSNLTANPQRLSLAHPDYTAQSTNFKFGHLPSSCLPFSTSFGYYQAIHTCQFITVSHSPTSSTSTTTMGVPGLSKVRDFQHYCLPGNWCTLDFGAGSTCANSDWVCNKGRLPAESPRRQHGSCWRRCKVWSSFSFFFLDQSWSYILVSGSAKLKPLHTPCLGHNRAKIRPSASSSSASATFWLSLSNPFLLRMVPIALTLNAE